MNSKVLDDADTDAAARAIAQGALLNSGQICMSTERVIVQRSAASSLIPALKTHFSRVRAGDTSAKISGLINDASAESVLALIRDAQKEGAELIVGDLSREGSVMQPHLVSGVKPGMRAWDHESFGPGK